MACLIIGHLCRRCQMMVAPGLPCIPGQCRHHLLWSSSCFRGNFFSWRSPQSQVHCLPMFRDDNVASLPWSRCLVIEVVIPSLFTEQNSLASCACQILVPPFFVHIMTDESNGYS